MYNPVDNVNDVRLLGMFILLLRLPAITSSPNEVQQFACFSSFACSLGNRLFCKYCLKVFFWQKNAIKLVILKILKKTQSSLVIL